MLPCLKRRNIVIMLFTFMLISFFIYKSIYQLGRLKTAQRRWRYKAPASDFSVSKTAVPSHLKTVLLWTNYYSVEWNMGDFEHNALCSNRCRITNDRSQFDSAAAVLFHSAAWDLSMDDLPKSRQLDQYFVYYNQESPPKSSFRDLEGVWQSFPPHFFNLTMTYRIDSDIVAPYDRFVSKEDRINGLQYAEYSWDSVVQAVRRKSKFALQFVGNCYSESGRETIVRALQRYVEIDQFGYCASRKCDYNCEQSTLPDYRFFIAFENNVCQDYVTEKFWRIKRLIVPIVLKASILEGIAPNGSFIAVDQFGSIIALAAHLKRLSQNETEYLRYFEWTKHYQNIAVPQTEAYCSLCDRLHAPITEHKSYADIAAWYYPPEICQVKYLNFAKEVLYMWGRVIALWTIGCIVILLFCSIVLWKCVWRQYWHNRRGYAILRK